jgi:hypothetical protein
MGHLDLDPLPPLRVAHGVVTRPPTQRLNHSDTHPDSVCTHTATPPHKTLGATRCDSRSEVAEHRCQVVQISSSRRHLVPSIDWTTLPRAVVPSVERLSSCALRLHQYVEESSSHRPCPLSSNVAASPSIDRAIDVPCETSNGH